MAMNQNEYTPVVYTNQIAKKVTIPGVSTSFGIECIYFTGFAQNSNGGSFVDDNFFLGSRNPDVMIQLARTGTSGSTPQNWLENRNFLYQKEMVIEHKLNNMSTGRIRVTGYRCMCRRDQARMTGPGGAVASSANQFRYPNILLGTGFAANGYDVTNLVTNAGRLDPTLTPFQSVTFCNNYKIMEIRSEMIEPGRYKTWSLRDYRIRRVHPEDMQIATTTTDTWNDLALLTHYTQYEHMRGEQFWLFKAVTDTVAAEYDIDSNITMTAQVVGVITNVRYVGEISSNVAQASTYVRTACGFLPDPGIANTDIINTESNHIEQIANL